MVIRLVYDKVNDLNMVQLIHYPLSLASLKSRMVLPFCYWHSKVVLEKRLLNG